MCPFTSNMGISSDVFVCFGLKIFLLIWVVFVPIAITSRLEQIIKLLKEKKDK